MKADLAERLSKLIPRLGSDHEGEVLATVLIIGRTLKANSMDWHDLAAVLTTSASSSGAGYHGSPSWNGYTPPKPKPPSKGLYTKEGFLRPWNQVLGEILERHETISKRYGGKFLTKEQVIRLERVYRGELAPHEHEAMIKRIDDRLNDAWKAQQADLKRRAA